MKKKMRDSTTQLMSRLMKSPDITPFLEANSEDLVIIPFHHTLRDLLARMNQPANKLYQRTGMDQSYCYMLLSGKRSPSRDTVLRLAVALELAVEDANELLNSVAQRTLYPRDQRDAVVVFALLHQITLEATNHKLEALGLKPL